MVPGNGRLTATNLPLRLLIRLAFQVQDFQISLLTQATGRSVVNKTGLQGLYDVELKFDPEVMLRMASQFGLNLPLANLPPSDSPALLNAIQEQLGLRLD